MDRMKLKKLILATMSNLEDHERFGMLFDLMLEECKEAKITRKVFLDLICNVIENPLVYQDFADYHPRDIN